MDKEHVTNFLRINDIPFTASDDAIREALARAMWHERDIDMAVLSMNDKEEEQKHVSANDSRGLFFTDVPIAPETLTSLLGVDVSVQNARNVAERNRSASRGDTSTVVILLTIFVSVILAFFTTLLLMYFYNIGPYYSPVENFNF